MLEFTFTFGVISLFFLLYYFKLDREHKEFLEKDAEYAVPFVDHLFKFNTISVAILSLFMMVYFAMMGDPIITTTVVNNINNFTSYYTFINGPNALNTTNQTLPVVSNYTRVDSTSFSQGQLSLIVSAYTVMQYLFLITAIIWGTTLIVRFIKVERDRFKKKREGDYD